MLATNTRALLIGLLFATTVATGCKPKPKPPAATDERSEEEKEFARASELLEPYIRLQNTGVVPDNKKTKSELAAGIKSIERVLALNPDNWKAWWVLGKSRLATKDYEAAYTAFRHAYDIEKLDPEVSREYTLVCLNLGKGEEALAAAESAAKLNPANPGLQSDVALALLINGQLEEAIERVGWAVESDPNDDVSRNVQQLLQRIQRGEMPAPKTLLELRNQ